MSNKPLDLDALQALCDAATPGPWETDADRFDDIEEDDAEFIAAAREAMPMLVARVRELEAEKAAMQAALIQCSSLAPWNVREIGEQVAQLVAKALRGED
jgi:chemotaxis receptor (MCP) glutamine deamidase CheD